ncbi:hypothetical protein FHB44_06690 [Escherichia coli]|nr:hypothetical protein [Escherichia coli]
MASVSISCPSCSATDGVVRIHLVYVKTRFGGFLLLEGQKDE